MTQVRVLGPVSIEGARGVHPGSKAGQAVELAAFLVLHPGATTEQIDEALWPGRSTEGNGSTRNPAMSRLRRWMGTNPGSGTPYLPQFTTAFDGVECDWHRWLELVGNTPAEADTADLAEALSLVRGRPFDGTVCVGSARRRSGYRYAWAEVLRQRITSAIIDAAEVLALRYLDAGRWADADEIAALGLLQNPGVESLWRIRIVAAYQSHNRTAMGEAIERLAVIVEDDFGDDYEPETIELLDLVSAPGRSFDTLADVLVCAGQ